MDVKNRTPEIFREIEAPNGKAPEKKLIS